MLNTYTEADFSAAHLSSMPSALQLAHDLVSIAAGISMEISIPRAAILDKARAVDPDFSPKVTSPSLDWRGLTELLGQINYEVLIPRGVVLDVKIIESRPKEALIKGTIISEKM